MIRYLALCCIGLGLVLTSANGADKSANDNLFPLITGEELRGEAMGPDGRGVIIKKLDGNFSERIGWTNFSQTALKNLLKALPRAKRYIEPLLEDEEPPPNTARAAAPALKFTPPDRLERPLPKAGFGNLFDSPLMVLLFFLLYAGNIYAAYEISLFRNYQPALVCGLAAVVPVIGPAIFLCVPTRIPPEEPQPVETFEEMHEPVLIPTAAVVEEAAAAPVEQAQSAFPPPVIYQRGATIFNRRFFETKLTAFLRMVPGEAEKDMVISIKSARGEYVGPRISKVQPNEVYLQIKKGDASSDVCIPFNEIFEVKIRHKDAA